MMLRMYLWKEWRELRLLLLMVSTWFAIRKPASTRTDPKAKPAKPAEAAS